MLSSTTPETWLWTRQKAISSKNQDMKLKYQGENYTVFYDAGKIMIMNEIKGDQFHWKP